MIDSNLIKLAESAQTEAELMGTMNERQFSEYIASLENSDLFDNDDNIFD